MTSIRTAGCAMMSTAGRVTLHVGIVAVAIVATSRSARAIDPLEGEAAVLTISDERVEDFYDLLCGESDTCAILVDDDRYGRFFDRTSWKLRIDPPSVLEGKIRVAYSPNDRVEFAGVRYLEDIVQVAPPLIEPGRTADENFVVIQFRNTEPVEGPIDIAEVIFSDRQPTGSPSDAVFTALGIDDDFLTIDDDGQLITLRGPGQIVADSVRVQRGPSGYGLMPSGQPADGRFSVIYNTNTGEVALDIPDQILLTGFNIHSEAGIFTADDAVGLTGPFDVDEDADIFMMVFGGGISSMSLGNVAEPGLSEDFILGDLTVLASLLGGGEAGKFDLVFINPEPDSITLAVIALIGFLGASRRGRERKNPRFLVTIGITTVTVGMCGSLHAGVVRGLAPVDEKKFVSEGRPRVEVVPSYFQGHLDDPNGLGVFEFGVTNVETVSISNTRVPFQLYNFYPLWLELQQPVRPDDQIVFPWLMAADQGNGIGPLPEGVVLEEAHLVGNATGTEYRAEITPIKSLAELPDSLKNPIAIEWDLSQLSHAEGNFYLATTDVPAQEFAVPVPHALPGPTGGDEFLGVLEVRDNGRTDSLGAAFHSLMSGTGQRTDGKAPAINHSDPDNRGLQGIIPRDMNLIGDRVGVDDNDVAVIYKGAVLVREGGDYTFNVHTDDGFAFRIKGATWVSQSGHGEISSVPDVLWHPTPTSDSNTRGVVNLEPGIHEIEFITYEHGDGANWELSSAKGAFTGDNQAQWLLVGDISSVPAARPTPRPIDVQLTQPARVVNADFADDIKSARELVLSLPVPPPVGTTVDHVLLKDSDDICCARPGEMYQYGGGGDPLDSRATVFPNGGLDKFTTGVFGIIEVDDGDRERGEVIELTFGLFTDDNSMLRIVGQDFLNAGGDPNVEIRNIDDNQSLVADFRTGNSNALGLIELREGKYELEAFHLEEGGDSGLEIYFATGNYLSGFKPEAFNLLSTSKSLADVGPFVPGNVGLPLVAADTPMLQPGDADQDLDFDQFDLLQARFAGKYLTGQRATWGEGDWDGAPGGTPGSPPRGDGVFNDADIMAAVRSKAYRTGPYAANGQSYPAHGDQATIGYDARTGQLWVQASAGAELTSIKIESAAGVFIDGNAENLDGFFDFHTSQSIFKATFGDGFGTLSFGDLAPPGLSDQFVSGDLAAIATVASGQLLEITEVAYVSIPEPASVTIALSSILVLAMCRFVSSSTARLRS